MVFRLLRLMGTRVSRGTRIKAVQRMLGNAASAMTLDTSADLFDDDLDAVADRLCCHAPAARFKISNRLALEEAPQPRLRLRLRGLH